MSERDYSVSRRFQSLVVFDPPCRRLYVQPVIKEHEGEEASARVEQRHHFWGCAFPGAPPSGQTKWPLLHAYFGLATGRVVCPEGGAHLRSCLFSLISSTLRPPQSAIKFLNARWAWSPVPFTRCIDHRRCHASTATRSVFESQLLML